ncbi:MAG TPA: sulfatase [Sphingobacteriaceae bacterium]|nr:sulfatase [Sphingobacteriaceae bacterium]
MKKILMLLIPVFLSGTVFSQAQTSGKPNIILIMGDDLTYNDIEPYGSKQVLTPNLTRLAKEGMCMDNMFTSTAMCAPTRQQLMTGLYPVRNGAYPNHSQVYKNTRSIAHYIKELGYNAALIGKQHYGPEQSFPYNYLGGRNGDDGDGRDIDLKVAENYITKSKDKPYLLIVTSNQPHSPWNRGDASVYPPEKIKLPPGFEDTPLTRKSMSGYFAEITYLDSLVGVCLDMVEKSGQKENTIVLFTSEQGSSFPFGKWTNYDQGLKTAFIARWPGKIKPSSRSKAMTQYVDVVPTLIELAGGNPSDINTGTKDAAGYTGFDGKSFKKVLFGQTNNFRNYVFGVHTTRGIISGSEAYAIRSARSDKYLYIHNLNYKNKFSNVVTRSPMHQQWLNKNQTGRGYFYEKRPEEELYDIRNDPYELVNLAKKPEMKKVKDDLKSQLASFMKQQGDMGIATEMKALERQPKNSED